MTEQQIADQINKALQQYGLPTVFAIVAVLALILALFVMWRGLPFIGSLIASIKELSTSFTTFSSKFTAINENLADATESSRRVTERNEVNRLAAETASRVADTANKEAQTTMIAALAALKLQLTSVVPDMKTLIETSAAQTMGTLTNAFVKMGQDTAAQHTKTRHEVTKAMADQLDSLRVDFTARFDAILSALASLEAEFKAGQSVSEKGIQEVIALVKALPSTPDVAKPSGSATITIAGSETP